MSKRHWYRVHAKNFACNRHPKQPIGLADALSEHVGMSLVNTRHLIDRLRHLSTCLGEPEQLTLYRLQQGSRQLDGSTPVIGDGSVFE